MVGLGVYRGGGIIVGFERERERGYISKRYD